jgi:hypothetical protein
MISSRPIARSLCEAIAQRSSNATTSSIPSNGATSDGSYAAM